MKTKSKPSAKKPAPMKSGGCLKCGGKIKK